jgi:hypothetical protein
VILVEATNILIECAGAVQPVRGTTVANPVSDHASGLSLSASSPGQSQHSFLLLQPTYIIMAGIDPVLERAECSTKYAAHMMGQSSQTRLIKSSAVVVDQHHLATYSHGDHEGWKVGDTVQVKVYVLQKHALVARMLHHGKSRTCFFAVSTCFEEEDHIIVHCGPTPLT